MPKQNLALFTLGQCINKDYGCMLPLLWVRMCAYVHVFVCTCIPHACTEAIAFHSSPAADYYNYDNCHKHNTPSNGEQRWHTIKCTGYNVTWKVQKMYNTWQIGIVYTCRTLYQCKINVFVCVCMYLHNYAVVGECVSVCVWICIHVNLTSHMHVEYAWLYMSMHILWIVHYAYAYSSCLLVDLAEAFFHIAQWTGSLQCIWRDSCTWFNCMHAYLKYGAYWGVSKCD